MGLFRKKPAPLPDLPNVILPGGRSVNVVGESFYQAALESIAGGKTEDTCNLERWAILHREPDNPYDTNAVAVYIFGQKVGHLSQSDAERYAPIIDELWRSFGKRAACRASITGGWRRLARDGVTVTNEGHYGVRLGLADPEDLVGGRNMTLCDDEELAKPPDAMHAL